MAIAYNTNYELRTGGNDNNGGGFVPGSSGTDYSQQNSAQYSFSDLASTNGTTSPSTVTSASHSFVAADVGNIMHITAGTNWTTGFYQIVSVSAGAATLDRAVGTSATLSGGTYAVGGALATFQEAFNACQNSTSGGAGNGIVIWTQKGTYTITVTITTTVEVNAQYISFIGYDTTRGDNTGNKPLLTTATNSTDLIHATFSGITVNSIFLFDNINFSNTAATTAMGYVNSTLGASLRFRRCKFTGFSNAINADNAGGRTVCGSFSVIQCEFASCTLEAIKIVLFPNSNTNGNGVGFIVGSYIHNCNSAGTGAGGAIISGSNGNAECLYIVDSIFDSNTGNGIQLAAPPVHYVKIWGSNFTNNTTGGDGIKLTTQEFPQSEIYNCIFWGNTNWGIEMAGATAPSDILGFNNAFGNNTTGAFSGISNSFATQLGQITLTANPFTSSTNFALNNTPGGGALLKALGWPNAFGSTTISAPDVGAVQSRSAATTQAPYAFVH